MLIEFTLQNFYSFNKPQTLSMLASSSTKESFNEENTIPVEDFGISKLLKGAMIFGANSSGKSNFIKGLFVFQDIILDSLNTADSRNLVLASPFQIKDDFYDIPTEFEVVFLCNNNIYRYGLSIVDEVIKEEWLYWTKTSRETLLFQRTGQRIEINKRSFKEAEDFIKKKNNHYIIQKTREDVPFISVLSKFNGKKSRNIINWFKKLKIISGIQEKGYKGYTLRLLLEDKKFKSWAIEILSSLQVQDLEVEELDSPTDPLQEESSEVSAIKKLKNKKKKEKNISIKVSVLKKSAVSSKSYSLPLLLESDGTQKLLYLLGPIYDVIKNGHILVIDEFDSKFHSLLSKHLLNLYHAKNGSRSQLIITCHDTNLLTKDLLRRDQIWFVEKNEKHESELFSLLEYKEHYTRKNDSYSKDYLDGKYGAIPLFSSFTDLKDAIDG